MIDESYQDHLVFTQLPKYAKFYKRLALSIMNFATLGTDAILNIDTYVYSSIQGTIESINTILKIGRINDSYALLRKYYDSTIINVYSNLYLNDHFNIDNFIVKQINNWLQGKERLPEYRIMSNYIRKSDKLKAITDLLDKDARYKEIRNRCNDHTHYNFYKNVLLNDNEIYLKNRITALTEFSKDLENIFIQHLSSLFYLSDHYMMSSDYFDSIEFGLKPEKNFEYEVEPFIQEMFDSEIVKNRIDLATEIKRKTSMKLL